jgi:hypothetical protein
MPPSGRNFCWFNSRAIWLALLLARLIAVMPLASSSALTVGKRRRWRGGGASSIVASA